MSSRGSSCARIIKQKAKLPPPTWKHKQEREQQQQSEDGDNSDINDTGEPNLDNANHDEDDRANNAQQANQDPLAISIQAARLAIAEILANPPDLGNPNHTVLGLPNRVDGIPIIAPQFHSQHSVNRAIRSVAPNVGSTTATVNPRAQFDGPDAAGGNPFAYVFPVGGTVQVVGDLWRQNPALRETNAHRGGLNNLAGRVLRSRHVDGQHIYEVSFPCLATPIPLNAQDLRPINSYTYFRLATGQGQPSEDHIENNDDYYVQSPLLQRTDPAGLHTIRAGATVRFTNFQYTNNLYLLNGQLAQVVYYNAQMRVYCVRPYFAPLLLVYVHPHNIVMPLYMLPPALFNRPSGHQGIILPRIDPQDIPNPTQFRCAAANELSITPICNIAGCYRPAAVNNLCQIHAANNNFDGNNYDEERILYLFHHSPRQNQQSNQDHNSQQNTEDQESQQDQNNNNNNASEYMAAYHTVAHHTSRRNKRRRPVARPSRYQPHDLRGWLPDSGATDHFTNKVDDLYDVTPCRRTVRVADGTIVYSEAFGKCDLFLRDDVTGTPLRYTMNVYYVPGLTQRLFSFREFLRHPKHQIHQTARFGQLDFGNGYYYTTPSLMASNVTNSASTVLSLSQVNATVTEQHNETPTNSASTPPRRPLPRIPMELAHARFGHRAHRSLLCGSLHGVWEDYLIVPTSDDYCEGCRIAASRSAPRGHRGPPDATQPFERIYIDIIPAPAGAEGLTTDSTHPCYLLIVEKLFKTSLVRRYVQFYFFRSHSLHQTISD